MILWATHGIMLHLAALELDGSADQISKEVYDQTPPEELTSVLDLG